MAPETRDFFELIRDFYEEAYIRMIVINGYSRWRLNVFVDIVTYKLQLQYACRNSKQDQVDYDHQVSEVDFLLFEQAYKRHEERLVSRREISDYGAVIHSLEQAFLLYGASNGYDKETEFAIVYVPIED